MATLRYLLVAAAVFAGCMCVVNADSNNQVYNSVELTLNCPQTSFADFTALSAELETELLTKVVDSAAHCTGLWYNDENTAQPHFSESAAQRATVSASNKVTLNLESSWTAMKVNQCFNRRINRETGRVNKCDFVASEFIISTECPNVDTDAFNSQVSINVNLYRQHARLDTKTDNRIFKAMRKLAYEFGQQCASPAYECNFGVWDLTNFNVEATGPSTFNFGVADEATAIALTNCINDPTKDFQVNRWFSVESASVV
eukprot:m.56382 g.56382  ORF g.56382 m.56382 type:complete len:258 (-) comp11191_c0_seq1:168-941(-)